MERPPEHVLAAFGLVGLRPVPLGSSWEGGWRCGEVVLSMVADHARAAWSAKVRETLFVDGVRLARPVRSTDGRYVVAGWRADTFVAGTPEPRHDEVVSAAVRLHEATAKLERPRFLTQPPVAPWADVDVFIAADRAAWEERPLHSLPPGARVSPGSADGQRSIELINQLAALRRPTKSPSQLVHGDLYGTVLFAGTAAPGITDITPYWRPASWAAGVVVVDALSWGEADDGLIERWSPLPEWPQMLLRALMFRLAVHALHPRSTAAAFPGLARTAALVRLVLYDGRTRGAPRLAGIRPIHGEHPFGAQQLQLPGGQMRGGATGRGDHPMPRQVRRVGAHDPANDARAGKPCGRSDVAVGRHPTGRDRGDQRAHGLDLFVGDGRHGYSCLSCLRITAAVSAGRACATM